jgi:hypothetical protein
MRMAFYKTIMAFEKARRASSEMILKQGGHFAILTY